MDYASEDGNGDFALNVEQHQILGGRDVTTSRVRKATYSQNNKSSFDDNRDWGLQELHRKLHHNPSVQWLLFVTKVALQ